MSDDPVLDAEVAKYRVVDAMTRYGGSFVKALADAWRAADPHNRRRLETTFADYFENYRQMADRA